MPYQQYSVPLYYTVDALIFNPLVHLKTEGGKEKNRENRGGGNRRRNSKSMVNLVCKNT